MGQMQPREFITLLAVRGPGPLIARAQQPGKTLTVGFLGSGTASTGGRWADAFVRGLRELGWIEGRTVVIDTAGLGRNERVGDLADALVGPSAQRIRSQQFDLQSNRVHADHAQRRLPNGLPLKPYPILRSRPSASFPAAVRA